MDKSRQQFEEWFKKEYPLIESQPENTLLQSVKRQCFKAWQASRKNHEPEIKHHQLRELVNTARDTAIKYQGCQWLRSALATAIKNNLISNGVKIKNE
ncbi:Uncharacterised protein [Providencia rustigianii]|nr:Uncharacterised protein [Providencia rustigianii]